MQKLPKLFIYILAIIFVINLVQSHFTQLIYDEAYYWYYSQNMAWGFFDHPPMVALLIKISSYFFNGELGVRFMSCILSVGTLLLLWLQIDNLKKKDYVLHFFVLTCSMTLLTAYGFLTLPDTPLLFFTALFLYAYKKFTIEPSVPLALGLGLIMSALMYSKYHAVLVIVFVLLSNLKLLTNKLAWLAVTVSLIGYAPHLLWLYDNDFVSIKYHLFERPNRAYDLNDFTIGYFVNLLAIFGLPFFWIYKALIKTHGKDLYTKALLFLTYGTLIFFFISSFNRRIQTQWIIVISISLAIIAFNYMLENENARKWIFRLGLVNIAILTIARFALVFEEISPLHYESHGNKEWVQNLHEKAGDTPVIFENSYRKTPMYQFYSGVRSFSLNNVWYRRNQYSIDDSESYMQHKEVFYVNKYDSKNQAFQFLIGGTEINYAQHINDFESFRKLQCILEEDEIKKGTNETILLKVYNPYTTDIALRKLKFNIAYHNQYKRPKEIVPITVQQKNTENKVLKTNDTTYFSFKLPKYKMENPGYFKVAISENGLYPGMNGDNIKLVD
ncbi:glycosyltransferase family 39 protein [Cellulophaga baltica]|uniref:ArnT family glycosyltransferase n=1 Tax=Cellulophaga TaxID=104264 RepID=UPI001C06E297|nr:MULTISPECIES: glycosyltransferase family 39 protein [Cellulophaga]MBU2995552.1 glycosyltransferase family 39 protein [Cellulophaga baltica]MDO6766946.1 glycosyltransferase family 39 protein [Cellulophaga sp. 1_MG-2023]